MFRKKKTNERPDFLNKADQLLQLVYSEGPTIDALAKEIQKYNEMLNILKADSILYKNTVADRLETQKKLETAMKAYDTDRQEYKREIARLKQLNLEGVDLEPWERHLPFDAYTYLKYVVIK